MATYGIPYIGSKSKIADLIIDLLPSGERLVDLFGGGGAITHCALLSDKWKTVLYNDIDPLITQFFLDAYNGKYQNYNRIVTKNDFIKLKDSDHYVKYIWSFSNCGRTYVWNKEVEPIKIKFMELICENHSVNHKRLLYGEIIKLIDEFLKNGGSITQLLQLEPLERENRLIKLGDLKRGKLQVSNISYTEYQYCVGDVVYCDIPYEDAEHNYNKTKFDVLSFYQWAKTREFPVYFSSYEISDDYFDKKIIKNIKHPFKKTDNTRERVEYLYCNKSYPKTT